MRTYTLAPLLAATLLTGCSSTTLIDAPSAPNNAPPADSSVSAGQRAFVFESGTVPIGDFDPFALAPEDYFDPCNDITEDEFRRAGFTGEIKRSTDGEIDSPHGTSVCSFFDYEIGSHITLMAIDVDRKIIEEVRNIDPGFSSEVLEDAYVYHKGPEVVPSNPCIAQLDTTRGGIGVFYYTRNENVNQEARCGMALQLLEALYEI